MSARGGARKVCVEFVSAQEFVLGLVGSAVMGFWDTAGRGRSLCRAGLAVAVGASSPSRHNFRDLTLTLV
jgi:hypothetical protein